MNFIERLDFLKKLHGDTNGSLSKKTGIPYSTIDSFYKKGWENTKLGTLRILCDYYHVTLDYIVGNDMEDDAVKQSILSIYQELSSDSRQMLLAQAEFFRDRERQAKKDSESAG